MMATAPSVIWLLLALFASYRMAVLIAQEEGPFALAEKLRTWAFHRHRDTWLERGINCLSCVSFWAACGAAALLMWGGLAGGFLILWGGLAGGFLILAKIIERIER